MFSKIKNIKAYYLIGILHALIAIVSSLFFFRSLLSDVGIENKAYGYFWSGATLKEDKISRIFVILASYALAVFLIFLFYRFVIYLLGCLKKKQFSAILFTAILFIGIFVILCLYPDMFGVETTDDYMNYVYAMEFLPMYWHGFFTNVVYCACMIVFPHPVAVPVIQFIFGLSSFFYFGYGIITWIHDKAMKVMISAGFLLSGFLLPEIIRVLIYPTRNCMYGILSFCAISILFIDNLWKRELEKKKFIILACLFAILGSWRGEGIFYMLAFPFLLYFTYKGAFL